MAKTDLLKEAIADAKAVKETAIANAKIALEEAFGSRLESMLGAKLAEQIDDEDELADAELDMAAGEEEEVPAELGDEEMDMDMDMEEPEAVRVGVDLDMDGEYDIEGELGAETEMEDEMDMEPEMGDEEMDSELDMELEEILKELEEGAMEEEVDEQVVDSAGDDGDGMIEEDIDAIIESILAEEDEGMEYAEEEEMSNEGSYKMKEELDEAYSVIEQLRYTINEVNLLNAKLLYTNKLFRNFELNDSQKMKVIENFDRAASTREVKLVFSTLSESFKKPVAKKKVVKEGYASKATTSTAPKQEIISESTEFANRWKKLAGLI
jgi:hypothetical protein